MYPQTQNGNQVACIAATDGSGCYCGIYNSSSDCTNESGCSWESTDTGSASPECQDENGATIANSNCADQDVPVCTGTEYNCTAGGWVAMAQQSTPCSPVDPQPAGKVAIGTYCLDDTPTGNCVNTTDTDTDTNTGGGCFIENTQVTMVDGSTKNIEEVQIGDKLRGNSGINTVLGFHRPILEGDLYSFNGGEFFVNDDHPFMTTDGWKSLNPAKTAQIHGLDLDVTLLEKGDIMVTDNGEIELVKISRKAVSGTTQLYNFNLDGDHTYYADGYLVHNKACSPSCSYGHVCNYNTGTCVLNESDCDLYGCPAGKYCCGTDTGGCVTTGNACP